jgi:hypothetical protein
VASSSFLDPSFELIRVVFNLLLVRQDQQRSITLHHGDYFTAFLEPLNHKRTRVQPGKLIALRPSSNRIRLFDLFHRDDRTFDKVICIERIRSRFAHIAH